MLNWKEYYLIKNDIVNQLFGFFKKYFIYVFSETGEQKEKETERNIDV